MRFVNHAPGARANLVARNVDVGGERRVALVARGAISVGAELLFDYGAHYSVDPLADSTDVSASLRKRVHRDTAQAAALAAAARDPLAERLRQSQRVRHALRL